MWPVPARVRPCGGDVDDAPRALLQHRLDERADHGQRAEDVDVEHTSPVLRRHVQHFADAVRRDEVPLSHPRVVQQHVHRPEALHRCCERRLDVVVARDVEFESQSSRRFHDGLRLLCAVAAPRDVAADDATTLVEETVRVGAAHASRRAGDHYDFAFERHSLLPCDVRRTTYALCSRTATVLEAPEKCETCVLNGVDSVEQAF